ncbi:DUF1566 domain-containing protein [Flavobacteriaceae bacterium]|nr:DUF1566 domain-containing protein [Flavobacteriaceae bacterium]
MSKIMYKSGNYVVVTDSKNVDRVFPISKTVYDETAGNFLISEGEVEREQLIIPVSDTVNWVDNDGTNYTEATFRDFLRTNTGCIPSAGGGGGGSTPIGATPLKTNQTVSYRTGDDGDLEAGRETDFFTLASANPFGTTERFTDELGGQTYTNNIVIDWSTYNGTGVLGYARNFQQGTWNDAIDNSLAYSVGSYTSGWRLANIREFFNIANYGSANTLNYSPFNFTSPLFYTSTGAPNNANNIITFRNVDGEIADFTKTLIWPYVPVRNFTVNGTILT